ncbi:MAG TPA: hypothetical protein VF424_13850 [Vicinamibacterales bacterium]
MRALTMALAVLVMAAMVAGHVDGKRSAASAVHVPAGRPQPLGPAAPPAGVEFLLVVR